MVSFAEAYPELVSEWSESNGDLTPEKISHASHKKVAWIGKCGHEWEAIVKNRGNGTGCPFCSGNRVLYGFNDFASAYPHLAAEWSELNYPLYPSAVTVKASRKVWWRCKKCGQHWKTRIVDRTDGHGCPVCTGEKLVAGVNDLATEHSNLAVEWSDKNRKKPSEVWPKSRENVWWECSACGFAWKAVINSRVKGQSCPACADRVVNPGFNDIASRYPELAKEWDQERNSGLKPMKIRATSHRSIYWKGRCGHRWLAPVDDRVAGEGCPVCEELRQNKIRAEAVKYYAEKAGVEYMENDDNFVGIPIQIYFPQQKMAIEFLKSPDYKGKRRRWENGKNWLCLNAGIRLVRILAPGMREYDNCICLTRCDGSNDVLSSAIMAAFWIGGIYADVDMERDLEEICRRFMV